MEVKIKEAKIKAAATAADAAWRRPAALSLRSSLTN
jgi:hypothetical protein